MELQDAVRLLRDGVHGAGGVWADLGAGKGTFTRALATVLGRNGTVFALDRDRRALDALQGLAEDPPEGGAEIRAVEGDFRQLDAVPELAGTELDGAVFANALHFVASPAVVLRDVRARLGKEGRIVVVEYEGRSSSPWIPHPLPPDRLAAVARDAGFGGSSVVGKHPSRYRGAMYSAVLRDRREPFPPATRRS